MTKKTEKTDLGRRYCRCSSDTADFYPPILFYACKLFEIKDGSRAFNDQLAVRAAF